MPLYGHLGELRKRVLIIFSSVVVFFVVGFYFSGQIIGRIVADLVINENIRIIVLTPMEYILTQIKAGFIAALILSSPIIIYEIIKFIRPALTKKERDGLYFILPSVILLLLVGVVFAYFIFLPVALYFLVKFVPSEIHNLWGLSKFVSFVLFTILAFGLIFELPIVLLILKKLNIINIEFLRKERKYVYVAIFIIAAIITPPDVVTQLIVALPLVVLYEISVLLLRVF